MRAVVVRDGALVVEARPDPMPGPGEVLLAVKAAGLNAADLLQRRGFYPAPPGSPPDIPGLEVAGEVVAVGDAATRFGVGERVMAVVGGGAQATHLVVHERVLIAVPASVDWAQAGGFPEAFTTAHDALFTQCSLAMGDRVCVHGAAGGVGTAAVQIAHAAGAHVTATVRDESRHDEVRALGADVVITPDRFADTTGYDVILELVGGPNMDTNIHALNTGGRISVIGVGAGIMAQVNLANLMAKRGTIHASTLRARPLEQKADAARRVEQHVVPLLADGRVRVPVLATYGLDEVEAAYDRFSAGGKLGKIVLTN
ncbi:MAG TPA: NAD(P)H-quinone oxidoreductase [Acidimicrobiales bacterium]|nr:NAD(P)H-quinone oxidoreductase [Acidimicrobiales bacterium]